MTLKLALPKGWLQSNTASYLATSGFGYDDYTESSRSYRPVSENFPDLFTKVFQERDMAIQVAFGNYDLAVCGLDWIQELMVKYSRDAIVKVRDLGFGRRNLYVAGSKYSSLHSVEDVQESPNPIRIVSEYPNLAENFALKLRLKNFRVLPVWGSTEAYPPEHAELAIVSALSTDELRGRDLVPIAKILSGNAWLIANKKSMSNKDLSSLLLPFYKSNPGTDTDQDISISAIDSEDEFEPTPISNSAVTLALPDGHQQSHAIKFLKKAGLEIKGYRKQKVSSRPKVDIDGVNVKIIRPQDMPLQVANGNFDLAVTGRDWLRDNHGQFYGSPVEEVVDLGFGWVRIVAVVHNDVPANTTKELRQLLKTGQISVLRIATEYTHLADKYARDNHLSPYKVIPTWGATEAFLPEDADVLVENTETGQTLARNNLKIIETIFESTGCLIGNSNSLTDPDKKERIDGLVSIFKKGLVEE